MEFVICGKISFDVEFEVEANSEEEALVQAIDDLKDYYRLSVVNAKHDRESVKINIDVIEYED